MLVWIESVLWEGKKAAWAPGMEMSGLISGVQIKLQPVPNAHKPGRALSTRRLCSCRHSMACLRSCPCVDLERQAGVRAAWKKE